MTDLSSTAQAQATKTSGTSRTGVVVDKKKTPEQYMKEAEALYIVPALVREKFSDLIKLIYETESMNTEEREYWLQIMPIMSEEQIKKFRDILVNERDQLSKLDQEYDSEMSRIGQSHTAVLDEAKMKEQMQNIKQAEAKNEKTEAGEEEEILKQMENM